MKKYMYADLKYRAIFHSNNCQKYKRQTDIFTYRDICTCISHFLKFERYELRNLS